MRRRTAPTNVTFSWQATSMALNIFELMALVGFPLGFGLLKKRRYALNLLYVMLGLSVLLVAVKLPIAIVRFTDTGDNGSAFPEAELLLLWLFSTVYCRKRQTQFH